jgi:hypothetical protein
MTRRELFLDLCRDLQTKCDATDRFEAIRASLNIRALFLDGSKSVVDQVNREHRVRFLFDVVRYSEPPVKPIAWFTLSPGFDSPASMSRLRLQRDAFFGMQTGMVESTTFTVREVVLYVAHVMGGVHAGAATTDVDRSLQELDHIHVLNLPMTVVMVQNCGRICLDALDPLVRLLR